MTKVTTTKDAMVGNTTTTTTGSMTMTEEELARHDSKTLLQLLLSADARCDALTAERDRLREALGAFVAHYPKGINPDLDAACFAARAALKGETP